MSYDIAGDFGKQGEGLLRISHDSDDGQGRQSDGRED